jgi:glycosyltransferase involved in cell wall biosynthesis
VAQPVHKSFRILVVHNAYQHRGGEDMVVEAEVALLRSKGHAVELYSRHNDEIAAIPRLALARQTLWSNRTVKDAGRVISAFGPDIVHVHNTFPLISPSLYWVAERVGVPVVQTLHNFRLLCPQAMFLRDGQVCEDCLGRIPWRGMTHRCYRGSVAQSGLLAGMLTLHRALGTYPYKVTRFIALNEFSRNKFIEGGLPADRIAVKPNFVDMPPPPEGVRRSGALFVGRLSPEKGIKTLVGAANRVPQVSIKVIGTGPDEALLQGLGNVHALGFRDAETVRAAMNQAACLVIPSICYENFPRTLVEAFACGLPAVASRLGAMASLIREGETGLLFEPGSSAALAEKLAWAEAHPDEIIRMGKAARLEYETKYTPEINYRQLMAIYDEALKAIKRQRV